jgi:hypothetical protein
MTPDDLNPGTVTIVADLYLLEVHLPRGLGVTDRRDLIPVPRMPSTYQTDGATYFVTPDHVERWRTFAPGRTDHAIFVHGEELGREVLRPLD